MALVVGVCEISVGLPAIDSIKEKRSVMRKLIQRTRNRYPISIAEVDEQDTLDFGVIGLAIVSNDRRYVNSLLDKVVDYMDGLGLARIEAHEIEILNY